MDLFLNSNKKTNTKTFQLDGACETILPTGTKLFLSSGTLTVNNMNVESPAEICIEKTGQMVFAVTTCYGRILE